MRGKIIVIEGTDCSGKETQTALLEQRLRKEGKSIQRFSFPMYQSATGKIVGGPYLGKNYISEGYFKEGADKVDPKVAALYYAADRKYNSRLINDILESGNNIILDRYVESNMAHQGGKIFDKEKRLDMYNWLSKLEYELLELPKPDLTIFLHMPYEKVKELKAIRGNDGDQHENSPIHIKNAESAYLELADIYDFKTIKCTTKDLKLRRIEDIHDEIYDIIKNNID